MNDAITIRITGYPGPLAQRALSLVVKSARRVLFTGGLGGTPSKCFATFTKSSN